MTHAHAAATSTLMEQTHTTVAAILLADIRSRKSKSMPERIKEIGTRAAEVCASGIQKLQSGFSSKTLIEDVTSRWKSSPSDRLARLAPCVANASTLRSIALAASLVGFAVANTASAQSQSPQMPQFAQSEARRQVVSADEYGQMCIMVSNANSSSKVRDAVEYLRRNPVEVQGNFIVPPSYRNQIRILLPAKITGDVQVDGCAIDTIARDFQARSLSATNCQNLQVLRGQYRGAVDVSGSGVSQIDPQFRADTLYSVGAPISSPRRSESWSGQPRQGSYQNNYQNSYQNSYQNGYQNSYQNTRQNSPTAAAVALVGNALRSSQGGRGVNIQNMATGQNLSAIVDLASGLLGGNARGNTQNVNNRGGR